MARAGLTSQSVVLLQDARAVTSRTVSPSGTATSQRSVPDMASAVRKTRVRASGRIRHADAAVGRTVRVKVKGAVKVVAVSRAVASLIHCKPRSAIREWASRVAIPDLAEVVKVRAKEEDMAVWAADKADVTAVFKVGKSVKACRGDAARDRNMQEAVMA